MDEWALSCGPSRHEPVIWLTSMSKRPRPRPPVRAATRATAPPLYHVGVRLFALFSLAMVVAFWPSYYSRLADQPSLHHHAHGLAMTAWLALLVAQAALMRSGRKSLHRALGLVSYALVPVIVVVTARFAHYTLQEVPALGNYGLFFLALVLLTLVTFVTLFALAMLYRNQPAVHARFMVATLFPLFTPVTDRLIGRFAPSVFSMVPTLDGSPLVQCAGFLFADVILASLAVWDWRRSHRVVFFIALAIVAVYQTAVLTFHRFGFWQAFGPWFLGLPLS
jgi:hypothetical protein